MSNVGLEFVLKAVDEASGVIAKVDAQLAAAGQAAQTSAGQMGQLTGQVEMFTNAVQSGQFEKVNQAIVGAGQAASASAGQIGQITGQLELFANVGKKAGQLELFPALQQQIGKVGLVAAQLPQQVAPAQQAIDKVGKSAGQAKMGYMLLGTAAKDLATTLMVGGNPIQALAVQAPQAIQGLNMLGIRLATLVPVVGSVVAVVGGGYLAWRHFTSGAREAARAADEFKRGIAALPKALEEVNTAMRVGWLSPQSAAQYREYLTGRKKLYKSKSGALVETPTEALSPEELQAAAAAQTGIFGYRPAIKQTRDLKEASLPEVQVWISERVALGKATDDSIKALAELGELQRKIAAEALGDLSKQKEEIKAKHAVERQKLQDAADLAKAGKLFGQNAQAELDARMAQSRANEAKEIAKAQEEYQQKRIETEEAAQRKIEEGQRKLEETRSKLEARRKEELAGIEEVERFREQALEGTLSGLAKEVAAINFRYDQEEKRLRRLVQEGLVSKEEEARQQAQLSRGRANETGEAKRLEALHPAEAIRKIQIETMVGLDAELARIDDYYDREIEQLKRLKLSLEEELALRKQIEAARGRDKRNAGIEGSLKRNDMESEGGTFGLAGAFSSDIERDAVKRSAAEQRLRDSRVRGEREMWSNMLAAAKYFGGEQFAFYKGLMTAMAVVDTARAAIGAYNSVVSIPYVGPILAVAAAAAAIAAGTAQIAAINSAGYVEGGYTGDGGRLEPAGMVHRGEYVFSAPAVRRIGRGRLEEMHAGGDGGFATGGGIGGGTNIRIAVLNDESRVPNWARSEEGEAHVVDIVRRNWHRLS